ncbi:MAG: urea transporter [Prevotella sp.]|jgi:urea transporter
MIRGIFRGVGQVMFQNNALSGILMLVGIACNSLSMFLFALLGTITSTLTAVVLKYNKENIENGLYGFNGTLVGIAVPCFMSINVWSFVLMVVASVATTLVCRGFERQKLLPTLTAPFVILTWAMLLVSYVFPVLQLPSETAVAGEESFSLIRTVSLNFGQIMLQGNSLLTGLFFFLAIFVNSRKMALDAFLACAVSLVVMCVPFIDVQSINNGLYGYNAILTVLAVANILKISSWRYTKALAALAFSLVFQYAGLQLGLVTLTAPFVLSVWLIALYNTFKVYRNNVGSSRAIG